MQSYKISLFYFSPLYADLTALEIFYSIRYFIFRCAFLSCTESKLVNEGKYLLIHKLNNRSLIGISGNFPIRRLLIGKH
jgi:hypothetical protein